MLAATAKFAAAAVIDIISSSSLLLLDAGNRVVQKTKQNKNPPWSLSLWSTKFPGGGRQYMKDCSKTITVVGGMIKRERTSSR